MINSLLGIFNIYNGDIYPAESFSNKFLGVFTYDAILTTVITLAVVFIAEGVKSRKEKEKESKLNTENYQYFKSLLNKALRETKKHVEDFGDCIQNNKKKLETFYPNNKSTNANLERIVSKIDHEKYFQVYLKETKSENSKKDYFKLFSYLDYFSKNIKIIENEIGDGVSDCHRIQLEYQKVTELARNNIRDILNLNGGMLNANLVKAMGELIDRNYKDIAKYHQEVILVLVETIDSNKDIVVMFYQARAYLSEVKKYYTSMIHTNEFNLSTLEKKLIDEEIDGEKIKGFKSEILAFEIMAKQLNLIES